jgi:hypothetical protein
VPDPRIKSLYAKRAKDFEPIWVWTVKCKIIKCLWHTHGPSDDDDNDDDDTRNSRIFFGIWLDDDISWVIHVLGVASIDCSDITLIKAPSTIDIPSVNQVCRNHKHVPYSERSPASNTTGALDRLAGNSNQHHQSLV